MRYALFLGCTIPVRGQNYELSARSVAKALGIEFVDMENFSCCGFPVKSTDKYATTLLAAKNIAIASSHGLEICTLCNACTAVLTETLIELKKNPELLAKVNADLKEVDLEVKPDIKVRHFSRILYEDIGPEKISEAVRKDMSQFSFSLHYGCHYLRPKKLYDGFDDAEDPETIEKLVKATGADVKDYKGKLDCCGGAVLGVEQEIALKMARNKLDQVVLGKVDGLITICPFCTVMYDDNQKKIEETWERAYNLPVLYYPQVLGLAMGIDHKELGFRLNKVKTKELLAKYEAANPVEQATQPAVEGVAQ